MPNRDGAVWRGLCIVMTLVAALAGCGGAGEAQAPQGAMQAAAGSTLGAEGKSGDVGGGALSAEVALPQAASTPIYRFAKISNGAYFYTGNAAEKQQIELGFPDFRYEGEAFLGSTGSGSVPVYRFANLGNGGYFYTASLAERDLVIASYPHMRYEGSTFSVASPTDAGAVPVYRLANLRNGAYLYTASRGEHDLAVATGTWRSEGEAFHALTGATAPSGDVYESTPRTAIPDNSSTGITSSLNVTRTGASGTVSVRVQITHTYIGDLVVELLHPDGTAYPLHNRAGGSADDLDQTYTVEVGSKPSNGTWRLRVSDRSSSDTGTLVGWRLSFASGSGGQAPSGDVYESTPRTAIPDNSSTGITSSLNVTRTGTSGTVSVRVQITHTYIGDLVVELLHPDGTAYTLHNRSGGSTDDLDQTYTVEVGSKASNGTWRLRVSDRSSSDTGTLVSWRLSFGAGGGPGGGSGGGDVYESTPRTAIPDSSSTGITSSLNVTRTGASGTVSVRVQITHTYIGDLVVELLHPDGTAYTLHNRSGGSTDNIDQTYTVNVGSKPSNGTWRLRVSDRSAIDTGTLTSWRLSFAPGSSQPSPGDSYENTQRVTIPDNSSAGISSRINVTRSGTAGAVSVRVRITHTYIGDLVVELVHPDGTVYTLHNRSGGSADNIDQIFTVNAGSKAASGTWTLRVKDVSGLDTGALESWGLSFGSTGGTTPDPDPGSGGDDVSTMPPQGWTLSGTISVAQTAAVDSDINDPNQALRNNDDFPVAQALRTPVLLVGTVNQPGSGPSGATRSAGDEIDVFRVSLRAGQVVELEFTADPGSNDLDLYVFNSSQNSVGESIGVNRYECVRILRDGDYYVGVHAYEGASIYNLRVGTPNEGTGCANSASSLASIVPGQLIASLADGAAATAQRHRETLQSARVEASARAEAGVPQLLQLTGSTRERAQAAGNAAALARSASLQGVLDTVGQAKRLQKTGLYAYVEPNRHMYPTALVGNFPPDDRYYVAQQWHYALISLPEAMSRVASLAPMPQTRPVVAVIDSGIVQDHPDLAAQIVDGYSFISVQREGDNNTSGGNDPSSASHRPSWHGTHVAGTVGAVTFNGEAGAGVAPMARIMPLRVFRPESAGATSYDIVQAILYASGLSNSSGRLPSRRADVINMSLGGDAACGSSYADAISRARAQGVIVVAASGNSARNDLGRSVAVGTPANCTGVISVGAVDARARQTYYANSGGNLSVVAPGGDQSQSTNGSGYPDSIYSTIGAFDNAGRRVASFGPMDGTSMASPHVAGVMALMRFVNPSITPAQVDTLLANGRLTDDIGNPGRDNATGMGLINARKAVDAALSLQGGGGGSTPAPSGTVVASPASLEFGSLQTSADLELRVTASTSESVTSITASSNAVTVTARQVDSKTRLGTYAVMVDRSRLSEGTHFLTLTVRTSVRQFTVALSVTKPGSSPVSGQGNFGPIYVLLVDPVTRETLAGTRVTASQGAYRWQVTGFTAANRVQVLAGTDLDNDDIICQRGEPCGGFPVLSGEQTIVDLTRQRTRLDFSVAPIGAINASALGAAAAGQEGVRKQAVRR